MATELSGVDGGERLMRRRYTYYRFEARINEDSGALGLVQRHRRNFDPLGAPAVAHDILEHFPDDNGTVDDEVRALGAGLWVRPPMGKTSHPDGIAVDLTDLYVQCQADIGRLSIPIKQTPIPEECVEEQLERVRVYSLQLLKGGLEDFSDARLNAWINAAVDHLRIGYRRALRRYGKVPQVFVHNTFTNIVTDAEKALKWIEEGQTVAFMVHLPSACTDFKILTGAY